MRDKYLSITSPMHPNQGLNLLHSGTGAMLHPTEPPGQGSLFFLEALIYFITKNVPDPFNIFSLFLAVNGFLPLRDTYFAYFIFWLFFSNCTSCEIGCLAFSS